MSWQTAVGRFYQLNPEALRTERLSEVRCNRGCRLATAVTLAGERVLIVHVHTTSALPATGVNATAPVDTAHSAATAALREQLAGMSGTELLEALRAGTVTEAQLEGLYRAQGDPRQIAYAATRADLYSGGNQWTYTRCRHLRGYLGAEHYNHSDKRPLRLSTLATERER